MRNRRLQWACRFCPVRREAYDTKDRLAWGFWQRILSVFIGKKEDIEETLQLMDRCVGENLYQKEELEQAIGSSERAFLLLRTAEGELAGYIYYYLTNEKQIAEDTRLTEQKINGYASRILLAPVGKIQSVGIKEAFRRQGLAVGLMNYALNQFAEKGIGEVFIICWNAGGKVPLERALQECKFVHLFLQR